ncbi:helix-turn-helix domain-containing protein [Aquimarina algiphila]|uniref:helix-turn-helix domain-containing protein n=1 Tax=Aquimarina algiphila TaxID=2047982 RepID=UPI002330B846|nr:AraC family transcriptional regulator [Aquimarina algiphila]
MIYTQQQAHKDLKDYIRCYWKVENKTKASQSYTIFPDGFFDVLICYQNNNLKGVFLTGLWNKKTNVVISPKTTIYGIQFRLLAVEYIIKDSIAPLLNKINRIEKSYLGLNQFSKQSDAFMFQYLNECLIAHLNEQDLTHSKKSILLKTINQTKGNETVEYYSQKAHWSQRQINRYFQSTFGFSLKSYCNIRKGASTYSQIKNGQLYPLEGYFDQSHFIKEIKKITEYTPKVLLKNENDRFLQFSIIKSK